MNFWYERAGIELRHQIGIDNIMWESDFPHSTSTFPESQAVRRAHLKGVPEAERKQLLLRQRDAHLRPQLAAPCRQIPTDEGSLTTDGAASGACCAFGCSVCRSSIFLSTGKG